MTTSEDKTDRAVRSILRASTVMIWLMVLLVVVPVVLIGGMLLWFLVTL